MLRYVLNHELNTVKYLFLRIDFNSTVSVRLFQSMLLLEINSSSLIVYSGPGSVVRIATGCGLDDLGFESWWGARFSAPVQTGPGAHPASCTMVTGSFPGVKSSRDVTLTPHSLLVPWS